MSSILKDQPRPDHRAATRSSGWRFAAGRTLPREVALRSRAKRPGPPGRAQNASPRLGVRRPGGSQARVHSRVDAYAVDRSPRRRPPIRVPRRIGSRGAGRWVDRRYDVRNLAVPVPASRLAARGGESQGTSGRCQRGDNPWRAVSPGGHRANRGRRRSPERPPGRHRDQRAHLGRELRPILGGDDPSRCRTISRPGSWRPSATRAGCWRVRWPAR